MARAASGRAEAARSRRGRVRTGEQGPCLDQNNQSVLWRIRSMVARAESTDLSRTCRRQLHPLGVEQSREIEIRANEEPLEESSAAKSPRKPERPDFCVEGLFGRAGLEQDHASEAGPISKSRVAPLARAGACPVSVPSQPRDRTRPIRDGVRSRISPRRRGSIAGTVDSPRPRAGRERARESQGRGWSSQARVYRDEVVLVRPS